MDLPSGTVTLLFSDVEGSTRLLLRLQSEYAAALDVHRAVLRRAWLDHHGVEVGTEGDSFMVAFASATDAVEAALAGQLGLQEATWPGGEPMRVRMGLHTGTPTRHADGYVGVDVHVAARVASAANGGQVLLSEATASLVRGRVDLLDVGRHRLKDLPGPERLFRLRAPMLLDLSTPVRSIGSTSNLPAQATPLVGRDDDVRRVLVLAAELQRRLVTLTGVGGTGKTRLALAAASAAAENSRLDVYFVALEGAATADDFWAAVAAALDLPSQRREIADIVGRLGESPAMLVLDNLEQVRGAPEAILHLLENSDPQLSVIATCRHPLHLPGEQEYPVPPLEVTEGGPNEGALELLVCCILRMRPSFQVTVANRPSLVEICRRLDGLPLALEIAAARLRLLSPRALLDQLDDVLDMRRSEVGRPLRHETLRATLRWSHDLLPTDAAHLFRCLSAFRGSADLDAVGWVWARVGGGGTVLELAEHLVDSSLIGVSEDLDGRPRVTMLNTVLAFADEQLQAADDADAVRLVVAEYFDDLTRRLYTDRSPGWRARLADRLELEQQAYLSCLAWLRSQIGPHHPSAAPMSLQMTYRIHLGLLAQRSRLDESARLLQ
jgi:predicted ATPase/class 3 adenylate cyclase